MLKDTSDVTALNSVSQNFIEKYTVWKTCHISNQNGREF